MSLLCFDVEEKSVKISLTDNVPFVWTGGHKCNFEGCDRPDLQPGDNYNKNVSLWVTLKDLVCT